MVHIKKVSETTIRIETDDRGILYEISEHFTFFVPGYRFMPAYRNKIWDGKIRLLNLRDSTLPFGLCIRLCDFLNRRGYSFTVDSNILPTDKGINVDEFISQLALTDVKGQRLIPRDYQISAVKHLWNEEKSLCISPTASGKSLIIYLAIRLFLAKNPQGKICIVVPTTQLTEQMVGDFDDYSQNDPSFNAKEMCHAIYSGREKNTNHQVIITTWQSAINFRKDWFKDFEMIIGDEAHLHKAKSLVEIMSRFVNARFRIGTTGTLDGALCHEWQLEGIFGPIFKVTTTKELIDSNTLAPLQIHMHVLSYSDQRKKEFGTKRSYTDEIDFIVSDPARMRYLIDLSTVLEGNTLILFNLIEKHGSVIHEAIKNKVSDLRKVFYIHGGVATAERNVIREIVEREKNAIICASLGVFSTGVNIRNLHNIVFASPTKSQIRVLQSIGRGLRRSDNNATTNVHDLVDDIRYRKSINYTFKHGQSRHQIYIREQFPVKLYSENIQ